MKKSLVLVTAVFAAILFLRPTISTAVTVADYPANSVANGIVSSRHNLGDFGRVITTKATTQVCIFCHTPHHANTQASPLWNRDVSQSATYTAYGTTVAGTTVNNADLGGATLACLSCHDGATTFDSLVNAPGKGGVVAGGAEQNWIFRMPGNTIATRNQFQSTNFDHFDPNLGGPCLGCHGSFFGGPPLVTTKDTIPSLTLGTDLTNDHPVSVPYSASTKGSLRPVSTVISTINLAAGLTAPAGETLNYLNNNLSQNRWAVSGFISDTATINDILRNNKVECSSCHDPHFRNLSYDEWESSYSYGSKGPAESSTSGGPHWCNGGAHIEDCADGLFLRRVGGNSGSGVCKTCHNK
ncbi:MAG: hypothetical protein ACE5DW_01720 [Thermodesulfobacteriota bacterium]